LTEPPLLALARGGRARPRKAVAPRPLEIALHLAVADVLRRFALPAWRWSHFPSGELRDVRTAAKLKAMGVQRGWPDFVLFDPSGRLHALELKRQGEGLTDDQQDFETWCTARGVPHAVARTSDEAIAALDAWEALRIKVRSGA
jgi:VRR-NUC domain-containing protein